MPGLLGLSSEEVTAFVESAGPGAAHAHTHLCCPTTVHIDAGTHRQVHKSKHHLDFFTHTHEVTCTQNVTTAAAACV